MQLYLDSFGAYLSVKNGQFRVRLQSGAEHFFAARRVGAVLLTKGTGMSADAALLAVEHDIPVLFIDAQTHYPIAQVSAGRPGNIATVRKNQPVFCRHAAGLRWAADSVAGKVRAQRGLLLELAAQPSMPVELPAELLFAAKVLADLEQKIVAEATAGRLQAESLRGHEGTASRVYFRQLGKYLAHAGSPMFQAAGPPFEGRQKRPAYDPFNALLNYLYGMLYTACHLALLKSGLDPFLGVLHADRHGEHATLVFDFIEPYRPWADRIALELTSGGRIDEKAFEPDDGERGLWLSQTGKGEVVEAMLDFMEKSSEYRNKQVKHRVQMDLDAQQLALLVKATGEEE